ncbi:hypothetical protein AGMMS49960_21760 [Betaproteobacteria bacterium]|nr:hypothetical protein AGMMS49543_14110 [Betaproteobacteria bacterium]GHU05379.1 hypothetical protein AGMMS49960_21760 [Betaproteobacteria bacterium]GHU06593.1 hypothetical protein AGMMS50225_02000 [Betaproteobacteria bacterium]GHU20877.1 hypothetical protein AGMMS50243_17070 [Betaproteobacteria bacterium]
MVVQAVHSLSAAVASYPGEVSGGVVLAWQVAMAAYKKGTPAGVWLGVISTTQAVQSRSFL